MNILTDELPATVTIDHTEYQLTTDFKTCLRIIMAFEDNDLTPQEKQIVLLSSIYQEIPKDVEQAIVQAHWFLNGGNESTETDAAPIRLYSFAKDAALIFAAFRQTHGIDLQKAQLHWWEFLALFMDLGQDTTFCQLTALRKRLKTGKATKEEKQAAREMGSLIDVPEVDDRTLNEKEAESDFLAKVKAAQERRKQNANT